jgi:hypothetical protein
MKVGLVLPLLLPVLCAMPGAAVGRQTGDAPEQNTSFLQDQAPPILTAMREADRAKEAEDWNAFVRAWQAVADRWTSEDDPGAAAPYVCPVRGTAVYEGAWRVAHHRILEAGAPALEAYRREYGDLASTLLRRALQRRDRGMLARVVDRFLPLAEGRRAALYLADLALERGDRDGAMIWLERLEDVEEVTAEDPAALAPWRDARIARMAAALAAPGREEEVRAFLAKASADGGPSPTVPPALRPPRARARSWPTTGGAADRAAVAPPVDGDLVPAWQAVLHADPDALPRIDVHADGRPSPWIPPRAVTDGRTVFVNDGASVQAFDAASGKRLDGVPFEPLPEPGPDEEPVAVLGLLEGYALTLGPATSDTRLLYAAIPGSDGFAAYSFHGTGGDAWSYAGDRSDAIVALVWDGRRLEIAWRLDMDHDREGLPGRIRLYGAPLLYRGRLWVAGIRPLEGSVDQAEAWLLGLDPEDGSVAVKTWLGAGPPVRGGRPDEAIPSSPAGAAGRVVVATSLGTVVAVDARHGRVHWAFRYDRGAVSSGRPRRLEGLRDGTPRQSGFDNQPPLLALQRVFVAPTDGPHLLFLFDRPRGRDRALVLWRLHRRFDFPLFAVEQVVGLDASAEDGVARLVLAGKGASPEGERPPPMVVVLDALAPLGGELWRGVSTTGQGAETYGRALLTAHEVVVPTAYALVVYDLLGGKVLQTADASVVPETFRTGFAPGPGPFGNLIPVPDRGILAVGEDRIALWHRQPAEPPR